MIATWSIPGSSNFKWKHVRSKHEAQDWWIELAGKSEFGWVEGQGMATYSDKEAAKVRWRDGSRIFK